MDDARVERCENCGRVIRTMAFKHTGACCELCRKVIDGEMTDGQRIEELAQDAKRRQRTDQEFFNTPG